MSYQGWKSTRDVQRDLRRVGQHGLRHALDKEHVVVGEQPPPQPVFMLDEESELQMRSLCGGRLPATHDGVVQPDVAGISRLLRMINGPDDELPEELEIKEEPQKEQTANEVVVISKLNPNCKEFVPRFNLINKTEVKDKEAHKKINECVPMILNNEKEAPKKTNECVPMILNNEREAPKKTNECVPMILNNEREAPKKINECVPMILNNEKEAPKKTNECVPMILNNEREAPKKTNECVPMILNNEQIDTNEKAKKEKEALEKKMKDLRKKIIDTSNAVCPKLTKDRNVAIVSLLKLHSHDSFSANNDTNDITGKRKEVGKSIGDSSVVTVNVPILKTPAYYEKCPVQKCPEELRPPKCFEAKPANIVSPTRIEKVTHEEKLLAAYVKESVNKVQKWLQDTPNSSKDKINVVQNDAKEEEKEINVDEIQIDAKGEKNKKATTPKKQKVSLHLGPVTFKRKNLPASPSCSVNSDTTENQKPKKEKCEEYKPSAYAQQLARKYAERNNNVEAEQGNILTWKIHVELKAREERILRERALEEARSEPQGQMDEASNTCVAS